MRLVFQPQLYLFGSILLHGLLFSLLVVNVFEFAKQPEPFHATINFEPPPKIEKPKPTATATIEKPEIKPIVEKPSLDTKSLLSSKLPSDIESVNPINNTSIDEILKNKLNQPLVPKNLGDEIKIKKSDLLGYLRANKKTEESTQTPVTKTTSGQLPKPPEIQVKKNPVLKKPEAITEKPKPDKTAANQTDQNAEEPTKKNDPLFQSSEQTQSNTDGTSDQKFAAQKIWRQKNEKKKYRNVLGELVSANWSMPITGKNFVIIIEATIDKNGNLIKTAITESSGLAVIDAKAKRAIVVSTPFPQLPKSLTTDSHFKAIFRFTPEGVGF